MTGALLNIDIRGRKGQSLRDKWSAGPRTQLGMMVEGFPNMFITTGPGSPSVLYNMVLGNEYHVDWICGAIDHLAARGKSCIDASAEGEAQWCQQVNDVGNQTLFPKANSWYLGANVPGKPRVVMPYLGGFRAYKQICDEVVANGYSGFVLN